MKNIFFLIAFSVNVFSLEIAPTNFDLRSLAIMVSQECNKNIIVSNDLKNLSVDYFITDDINPDLLFDTFKRSIEAKNLFLNDYVDFFVVSDKEYKPVPLPKNKNIELTMKIVEINNDKFEQEGFNPSLLGNTKINISSNDFRNLTFNSLFSLDFQGLLVALEKNDYLKILSEPRVVVANGKTTSMNVGDTVIVKTSAYGSDSNALGSVRSTYTQKDLGLTIKVTPHLQDDGLISITTVLTLETLKKDTGDGFVITAKKSLSSDFYLHDGGSIAIGGLTSEQELKDVVKIPILGDIPILEYLFSYESNRKVRNALTIFIQVKVF